MTKNHKYEILGSMYTDQVNILKKLFWEFDLSHLDFNKYQVFIIERVLEKGKIEHIKLLFKIYSASQIQNVVESSMNLGSKSRNFWKLFFKYATL